MRAEFYPASMSRNLVRIGRREYGENLPAVLADISERCGRLRIIGLTSFSALDRHESATCPIGLPGAGTASLDPARL